MERKSTLRIVCIAAALLLLLSSLPLAFAQANVQGQWSTLPYLMPINPVHTSLLNNGKVLIVSGSGNVAGNTDYEAGLWDPQAGSIATQPVTWDMFCNGMVVLPDGLVLVDGGTLQYDPFHGQPLTSLYDLSTNTFSNGPSMAHGRWYPTVTVLGDGRVMTFSGLDENGNTNTTVEIFSEGIGWSAAYSAGWTPPLYPRMNLLPNGKVFYSGSTTTSRLFDPAAHTWSTVATTRYSGTRTYGSSVLLPLTPANNYAPKVFIMGGGNPSTATTELIDLSAPTPVWQWGPNMSQPRIEMNAVLLPTGKVLALGGSYNDEDANTASLNADLYDPATNTFSSAGANAYPRLYHSVALLMPDASVWVAGGNPQRGTYEQHMEIYQPAYLFTTDLNGNPVPATRPSMSGAPAVVNYGSGFTVQTPDAANIAQVVLARDGSSTHAFDMDQRIVGLQFTAGAGALTVTGPPSGNVAPPGYYMLFLINSAGVPSVASFVQVVQPADFSVGASPASQSVVQGGSTSYSVNIAASGGFNGAVSFSVSGLPGGATAGFSPATVAGSGSTTLSIATLTSTAPGSYPLIITATSGNLVHTANVTLVVGGFTVSAAPASRTVRRGASTTYTVSVSATPGFTGAVSLSVSGLPGKTNASFSPPSVTGSGSSTLTVKPNKPASPGSYTLTITGTSGGMSQTTTVGLTVQ